MKFSHSLKFNAVADWWDEYISYEALKKYIYLLEKRQHGASISSYRDLEATEVTSLIPQDSADNEFKQLLNKELLKMANFYTAQEKELSDEMDDLMEQVLRKESQGLYIDDAYDDDDDYYDDDDQMGDSANMDPTYSSTSMGRRRAGSLSKSPRRERRLRQDSTASDARNSVSSSDDGDLDASIASMQPNLGTITEVPTHSQTERPATWSPSSPSRIAPWKSPTIRSRRTSLGQMFKSLVPGAQQPSESVWTAKGSYAWDTRLLFKRKITRLYLSMASLKSYVELNHTGFRKILKKYDKVTDSALKDSYLHDVVEQAYPFLSSTRNKLKVALKDLVDLYAKCVTQGDMSAAYKQLRVHQREHIAWERDTVWRQMIGNERRGETDGQSKSLGDSEIDAPAPGVPSNNFIVQTPLGQLRFKKKKLFLPIAIVVFIILLHSNIVDGIEANNCFAILVFATFLWATEPIPLFVTSLLTPSLLVLFRTIRRGSSEHTGHERLTTPEATKYVFSVMFSPTIMLLIGGFTIASAISKTKIDRVVITRVLSLAGRRPNTVLLAVMGVACFASMWISNVAAPTLCFSLIQPILRTLPPKTSFAPSLIIGIALAANIGGQTSPISSPQNLIALKGMGTEQISWIQWFAVALPVSTISVILIWMLLVVSYRPSWTADGEEFEIKAIRPTKEKFTLQQWWVTVVCAVTITLWCMEHGIEEKVGDMGVIAILPIVLFFSTGVLSKADFEQFLWTVVFLAMGGIALGKAVDSSGLLQIFDIIIRNHMQDLWLYPVVLVLSLVVLIVSTFISHTIASVLLVPIAAEVGKELPGSPSRLLVFLTALICSTGMGMPVSGFPNQTAATQVDELGVPYLTNVDFLKNGVPASIIATLVVATVGYLLMRVIGL